MSKNATIYAELRERYCAPEHALFFEVANGTGSNIRRYADALAMNLFPSRGLTLSGFEIKVSRHDWQRELANPKKVEEGIFKYCDHWWITAPQGIVQKDELPPTWGLLELQEKKGLRQVVRAPRLKAEPLARHIVAAILRRASEADEGLVREAVRRKDEDREKRYRERLEREVDSRTARLREQLQAVEGIERQLGMKLTDWYAHEGYGRIIKAIDASGIANSYGSLRDLAQRLGSMAKSLEVHIAEFDALAPDVPRPDAETKAA